MEDNNESKGSRAHDWELLSMSMSTLDPKSAPADSASESQHTESFNAESIRDSKYFACPTPFENPGAESSAQEEFKAKEEVAKNIPTEQLGPVGCLGEAAPSSSDDRAEMEEESAKKLSSHVATPKLHDADDKSPLKDSAIASCRTWWKRQSSMLISHMKEANAILSIAVAAAVVGLVILGHRWHQERCQNRQLHERVHELTNKLSRSARHRISVRRS